MIPTLPRRFTSRALVQFLIFHIKICTVAEIQFDLLKYHETSLLLSSSDNAIFYWKFFLKKTPPDNDSLKLINGLIKRGAVKVL